MVFAFLAVIFVAISFLEKDIRKIIRDFSLVVICLLSVAIASQRQQGMTNRMKALVDGLSLKSFLGISFLVVFSCLLLTLPIWSRKEATSRKSECQQKVSAEVEPEERIPLLIREIKEKSNSSRWLAAYNLSRIGQPAIPALVELIQDHDSEIRKTASFSLSQMGKIAVPALVVLLGHQAKEARTAAASCLSDIGPGAKEAIPALIGILGDEKARKAVSRALVSIGGESIPALGGALRGKDLVVSAMAAITLGRLGAPAIAELEGALDSPDFWTRFVSMAGLAQMGAAAVPSLEKAAKNADTRVRVLAGLALAKIQPGRNVGQWTRRNGEDKQEEQIAWQTYTIQHQDYLYKMAVSNEAVSADDMAWVELYNGPVGLDIHIPPAASWRFIPHSDTNKSVVVYGYSTVLGAQNESWILLKAEDAAQVEKSPRDVVWSLRIHPIKGQIFSPGKPVFVRAYRHNDGTLVRSHWRRQRGSGPSMHSPSGHNPGHTWSGIPPMSGGHHSSGGGGHHSSGGRGKR